MSANAPDDQRINRWLTVFCGALTVLLAVLSVSGSRAILPADFYRSVAPRSISGGIMLLNINTASAVALEEISGIGPVLAQRIIDRRDAHGPYQTVDELLEVEGIGPTVLAHIRPFLTAEALLP